MIDGDVRQRRAVRRWGATLVVLCVVTFWVQCTHIAGTLPYPRDTDEGFVSGPASRTLMTGTLHPYKFNYPSLPKYLASVGMAAGFLRAATHLEIRDIQSLGNVGYPYYATPRAMQGARQLFALLSVIALAATGIAAWQALHVPSAIVVAPLLLAASPLFFYHSWVYLNVDIVGLCFSTLTIAACLIGTRRPSLVQSAIVPGVYAGLATGSKYTLALVIVPVLVAIGLYLKPGRRMWAVLAALGTMVLAFLAVVPYSLIDLPGFLDGVAFEAFHYASGHAGWEAEPGLQQVGFYLRHVLSDYGPIAVGMSLIGTAVLSWTDWRRAMVLLAFPLSLGWLLATQRVHFERNVLALHPVVTVMAAYGLVHVHRWVWAAIGRRIGSPVSWPIRATVAAVLALATVPVWQFPAALSDHTDSRNLAEKWIEARVPVTWAILVPRQIGFDTRALKARGSRVVDVDLQAANNVDAFGQLLGATPGPAVIVLPHWGADARFEGQASAEALNAIGRLLKPVRSFGTNPVLVNYTEPVPWGDPQFGIVALGGASLQP